MNYDRNINFFPVLSLPTANLSDTNISNRESNKIKFFWQAGQCRPAVDYAKKEDDINDSPFQLPVMG